MEQYFHKYFTNIAFFNILIGIYIPGLPTRYKKYNNIFFLYCIITILLTLNQSIFCLIVIFDNKISKNLDHIIAILSIMLSSFIANSYIVYYKNQLNDI